jgi:hypothetical protein
MYEMFSESRAMYGINIWGLDGGWKETNKIRSRFCTIGVPRFAANNVAELELGMNSRRGEVLSMTGSTWTLWK